MRKPVILLGILVLFFAFLSGESYAQKKKSSKAEKDAAAAEAKASKALEKEWKKKLKDLDPLAYKKLVDDKASLTSENSELNSKIAELESQKIAKNNELEKFKAENKTLQDELGNNVNATKSGVKPNAKGIVFKVQVGAFRDRDLSQYFEKHPNFSGEDENGIKKYTLCYFSDYNEASRFKDYIRHMGVSDAWVVAYKDGQRINIAEAR
jgi:hypothetical protein